MPLEKTLHLCRTSLAGAELCGQRLLEHLRDGPRTAPTVHGIAVDELEEQSLLMFLARAARLLVVL